ncbi:uncharacterized protein TNCV_4394211 [Trichonephila clavipes]|uniref:Uncharacterized protein n=1 Tax=Trichonephila clavipes TaxID=2585209 RepID=A0A8X6W4E6_TRICX|nr:uncharacterized protein TNCV_4394211 [Trichonephila clavipes]
MADEIETEESERCTTKLLETVLVILSNGQMARMSPELELPPPFPNVHTTLAGGRLSLDKFNVQRPLQHNEFSAALVAAVTLWSRYRIVAGLVTSSSPLPVKTHLVGERCTLNLSRALTSSRWCGAAVRRGRCQLRCRPRHLTIVRNDAVRHQKPSSS